MIRYLDIIRNTHPQTPAWHLEEDISSCEGVPGWEDEPSCSDTSALEPH